MIKNDALNELAREVAQCHECVKFTNTLHAEKSIDEALLLVRRHVLRIETIISEVRAGLDVR